MMGIETMKNVSPKTVDRSTHYILLLPEVCSSTLRLA